MRAVDLAKVAASAEALRLKRLARRQAIRAVYVVGGVLFALAAFALLHVLAYVALLGLVAPWLAALIVFIVDLVIAGVFASIALNSAPDRIEREALAVRRESLVGARKAFNVLSVAGELTGFALTSRVRREVGRPGLGRYLMLADIVSRVVRRRS